MLTAPGPAGSSALVPSRPVPSEVCLIPTERVSGSCLVELGDVSLWWPVGISLKSPCRRTVESLPQAR